MQLLSAILFSLSANLDNLTIGIAYGIRDVHIGAVNNLMIALISCVGTFLSMSAGTIIANFLPGNAANILGCAILISFGLYFLVSPLVAHSRTAPPSDGGDSAVAAVDANGEIPLREVIAIACALTVNNLGMGIGASIGGLSPYLASACTLVISLITITAGQYIGKTCFSKLLGGYTVPFSGLIILGLGVFGLVT